MKKVKRKIIRIDEDRCDGCGTCVPSCPEQALQIVETPKGPKARLVKELYCDGLGACMGSCPTGALAIIEEASEPYNEEATIARIKELAPEMLKTHLEHLNEHNEESPKHHSPSMPKGMTTCPGSQMLQWKEKRQVTEKSAKIPSALRQWPIQLHLVPAHAPYFQNADLVITADCVPFAYANFHEDFLKDKAIAIGCPKLDDPEIYVEKIANIINAGNPKSIEVLHMEVPCCFGLVQVVQEAIRKTGKKTPFKSTMISIKGERSE